jgi:Putative zinc-finger
MNCGQCKNQISEFLDGELETSVSREIESHLSLCRDCAVFHEDFSSILGICREKREEPIMPPNPQAMWCRINNIIETEVKPEIMKARAPKPGFWSAVRTRNWSLSLSHMVSAVVGVALISSLLTLVGARTFTRTRADDPAANAGTPQLNIFESVLGKIGLIETPEADHEKRLKEQQVAIDYWNKRVEARRAQWDNHLREAFDRNLHEINQAVAEYTEILQTNPQDDISNEMLDSALNEKMVLLREFSEL